MCRIENGIAHIVSRNGKEWTDDFPTIARASAKLPVNTAWLDGEICVVDAKGCTSFQALQNVLSNGPGRLVYFVFDLLHADGIDLRGCSLLDRKFALHELIAGAADPLARSGP